MVAMLSTSIVTLKFLMESPMLSSVDSKSCRVAEVGSLSVICSPLSSFSVTIARLLRGLFTDMAHTR